MDHSDAAKQANNCIIQKFPERILLLNEILRKSEFHQSETDLKSGNALSEQGFIPSNTNLTEVMNILQTWSKQLVEDTKSLKLWIALLIPKIEHSNNSGIFVQKYLLAKTKCVGNEVTKYIDKIPQYFYARGKINSMVKKYPLIKDFQLAVEEIDYAWYNLSTRLLFNIRNHYVTLYDKFIKNFDKIKNSRSSNICNMY